MITPTRQRKSHPPLNRTLDSYRTKLPFLMRLSRLAAVIVSWCIAPAFVSAQEATPLEQNTAALDHDTAALEQNTAALDHDGSAETLRVTVSTHLGVLGRYDHNPARHPIDIFGDPTQSFRFTTATSAGVSIAPSLTVGRYLLLGLDFTHHSYGVRVGPSDSFFRRHLLRAGLTAGIHREFRTRHFSFDPTLQIGAGMLTRLPRYRSDEPGETRFGWFFTTQVGATIWLTRGFGVMALFGVDVLRIFDQDFIASEPEDATRKMAEASIRLGLALRI